MTAPAPACATLLTPPGAGAIAITRVLGPGAAEILHHVFHPRGPRALDPADLTSLRYGKITDGDEVIDDVVVAGSEIRGQTALDISAHGGIRVIERILQTLEKAGAKLVLEANEAPPPWPAANLIEIEALDCLSRATTEKPVTFLAYQRRHLVPALLAIADEIDAGRGMNAMHALMDVFGKKAHFLMNGTTIVLVGPPNSGKSTLFNRLVGREAAVVSPIPGTTRDWVSASIDFQGYPLTVIDTAGHRSVHDELEQIAIARGRTLWTAADLLFVVWDASRPADEEARTFYETVRDHPNLVIVLNKIDVPASEPFDEGILRSGRQPIRVSALTGEGFAELEEFLLTSLGNRELFPPSPCLFTPRQFGIVSRLLLDLTNGAPGCGDRIRGDLVGLGADRAK